MSPLPLYFLGPIPWFQHLLNEQETNGKVTFEVWEHFPKQTHRNRIELLSPVGREKVSIELHQRKSNTLTKDIGVKNLVDWSRLLKKKLDAYYAVSSYYEFYRNEFFDTLSNGSPLLIDINLRCLHWYVSQLGMELAFEQTAHFVPPTKDNALNIQKKNAYALFSHPSYRQVFVRKGEFVPQLSILDILFNLGPEARNYFLELAPFSSLKVSG